MIILLFIKLRLIKYLKIEMKNILYSIIIAIFLAIPSFLICNEIITTELGQKIKLNQQKVKAMNFVSVIQDDNSIMMEQMSVENVFFQADSIYMGDVIGIYKRLNNKVSCIGYRDKLREITSSEAASRINLDSLTQEEVKVKFKNIDSAVSYTKDLVKAKILKETSFSNLKTIKNDMFKFKMNFPTSWQYKKSKLSATLSQDNSGSFNLSSFADTSAPSDWNQIELINNYGIFPIGKLYFLAFNKSEMNTESYLKECNKYNIYKYNSKTPVNIKNKQGLEIYGSFMGFIGFHQYLIESKDKLYIFTYMEDAQKNIKDATTRNEIVFQKLISELEILD